MLVVWLCLVDCPSTFFVVFMQVAAALPSPNPVAAAIAAMQAHEQAHQAAQAALAQQAAQAAQQQQQQLELAAMSPQERRLAALRAENDRLKKQEQMFDDIDHAGLLCVCFHVAVIRCEWYLESFRIEFSCVVAVGVILVRFCCFVP